MSAEKDKEARAMSGRNYTPEQMSYILYFEIAKDPNGNRLKGIISALYFVSQLPAGTLLRFDSKTLDIQVGSNKGEIKTG